MNLIKQFNQPDTYLVISDYPENSKKGQKNYGIAWYTKELIEPMAKKYGVKFVVLAEDATNNRPQIFQNGKILLLRIFDQKHPSLFPKILTALWKFNKVKNIHVHSEFAANGGLKNMLLILPFLLLIKLNRKNITYFSHNVVVELDSIAPHLNLKRDSLKFYILSYGLKYYYKALGIIVDKFVVMDDLIQKRLSLFVNPKKIFLNPFWVKQISSPQTQEQAREILKIKKDEFVLLYFGFITYYKGADWILKTVKKIKKKKEFKKIRLILAGGEAYSLKDKPYYQKFYSKISKYAKQERFIQLTGFLPEDKIDTYFKASDLVVFPYRGVIGSSASMLHAISYKKPFIISKKMKHLLTNEAGSCALNSSGIDLDSISFSHTLSSFEGILKNSMQAKQMKKLARFSTFLYQTRERNKLITNCYNKIYSERESQLYDFSKLFVPVIKKLYALL